MKPIAILSMLSFSETQKALEAAVPALDLTFQAHLARGDYAGARRALEALPALNNFVLPPRNFTGLLLAIEREGQALQYEIGNPLTAATMIQYDLDISLETPRRVVLEVDGDGRVEFKFNALAPLVAPYGIPDVDAVARMLDAELTRTLRQVGGHDVSS